MLLIFEKCMFHRNASSFWMNNCHSPTLSGLWFRRPFVFFSRHMKMQLARVVGGRAVSWLRPRVRQIAHRSATFHGPPTRHNRRKNERGVLAFFPHARARPMAQQEQTWLIQKSVHPQHRRSQAQLKFRGHVYNSLTHSVVVVRNRETGEKWDIILTSTSKNRKK